MWPTKSLRHECKLYLLAMDVQEGALPQPPQQPVQQSIETPKARAGFSSLKFIGLAILVVAASFGYFFYTNPQSMQSWYASTPVGAQELQSKRDQVKRAQVAFDSIELYDKLATIVEQIRAYKGNDDPGAQAFAEHWGDKVMAIKTHVQSLRTSDPNTMTLAELNATLEQMAALQTEKQSILAAYNSLDPEEISKVTDASSATGSSTEKRFNVYTTAYGWPDNTPPGAVISNPIIHQTADGSGTYTDPITIAVGHSIINGVDVLDYPAGTKFYIPNMRRYFIVEDTCGDGQKPQNGPCHSGHQGDPWMDLWIGGQNAKAPSVLSCEDEVTGTHLIIENPAPGYAVVSGPIFNGSCAQQYGESATMQ